MYHVLGIIQEYRFPPLHQTTLLGNTSELGGHEWSGRLLETISGYFPFPAASPHYFRTLHFVEHRLPRRHCFMGCSSDMPIIMETLWHRCILPVGPPILE